MKPNLSEHDHHFLLTHSLAFCCCGASSVGRGKSGPPETSQDNPLTGIQKLTALNYILHSEVIALFAVQGRNHNKIQH